MENWKYGSREDNEHSVSCSLPVFHPASKPKIYFLILLNGSLSMKIALRFSVLCDTINQVASGKLNMVCRGGGL